jgi:hypothetical protein
VSRGDESIPTSRPLTAKGALSCALHPLTVDRKSGADASGAGKSSPRKNDTAPDPEASSVHPAQMLGMLLDMGACMDLDSRLAALGQGAEQRAPRSRAGQGNGRSASRASCEALAAEIAKLREDLIVQIDTLESTLDRFLGQLSRRTGPLTDAAELSDVLAQNGVPATRRPAAVRAAARSAASAYHAALTGAAERSRSAFVGLRRDLRGRLGALGDAATEIERLDALLTWGTHQQRNALFERVGAPMDAHFLDSLSAALEALPESPAAEDLQPWFEGRGWVERHRRQCEQLVRGIFHHERRAIVGLVEAAIEVASPQPARLVPPATTLDATRNELGSELGSGLGSDEHESASNS